MKRNIKIVNAIGLLEIMAPKFLLKMVHREDKEKLTRNCKCHVDPYLPDTLCGKVLFNACYINKKGFYIIMLVFKLASYVCFDL